MNSFPWWHQLLLAAPWALVGYLIHWWQVRLRTVQKQEDS